LAFIHHVLDDPAYLNADPQMLDPFPALVQVYNDLPFDILPVLASLRKQLQELTENTGTLRVDTFPSSSPTPSISLNGSLSVLSFRFSGLASLTSMVHGGA
jgi:hypothetical protein